MSGQPTERTAEEIAQDLAEKLPIYTGGAAAARILAALRAAEDRGWNGAVERLADHVVAVSQPAPGNREQVYGAMYWAHEIMKFKRPPRAEEGEKAKLKPCPFCGVKDAHDADECPSPPKPLDEARFEEIVRRYDRLLTEHLRRFEAIEKRLDAIERRPKSHKEPQ